MSVELNCLEDFSEFNELFILFAMGVDVNLFHEEVFDDEEFEVGVELGREGALEEPG